MTAPIRTRLSRSSRWIAASLATVAAIAGLLASTSPASAAPARPGVPRAAHAFGAGIEPMTPYVAQDSCDPHVQKGTRELGALLEKTYPGTTYYSAYACGTDGSVSEHYEGRAIDWMVSVTNKRQHADAKAFLKWLLATDSRGDRFAMARRLGVMYVIYDDRIWGAWDGRWDDYNSCSTSKKLQRPAYANSCHRTHIHISLSWNGAEGRTTFWTGHTFPTDFGPCRVGGLNWAPVRSGRNLDPCGRLSTVAAPKHASATKKALVEYSGAYLNWGSSGPAVEAVQRALHVPATAQFAGQTRAALLAFQAKHQLVRSGTVTIATWRALLAVTH